MSGWARRLSLEKMIAQWKRERMEIECCSRSSFLFFVHRVYHRTLSICAIIPLFGSRLAKMIRRSHVQDFNRTRIFTREFCIFMANRWEKHHLFGIDIRIFLISTFIVRFLLLFLLRDFSLRAVFSTKISLAGSFKWDHAHIAGLSCNRYCSLRYNCLHIVTLAL